VLDIRGKDTDTLERACQEKNELKDGETAAPFQSRLACNAYTPLSIVHGI